MKNMTQKKWIGVVLMAVGVLALAMSHYINGQVGEEMGKVHSITSPLSKFGGQGGKTAGGLIEGRASGEAAGYLQNASFLMVGGIALIVVGGCLFFLKGKKK